MVYRPYGKTGLTVSAVGFGGMRFEKPDDIDAMAEVVVHAHQRGITYFDTAPFYCGDKSEDIMGAAVKQMKRTGKPFVLSTKCGAGTGDAVRASIEKSLARLHVDSIDLFHCWCLMSLDQLDERIKGGAIDALLKARDEGLIKHAVVSTHMSSDEMVAAFDRVPFEGLTCGYNALNFRMRRDGVRAAKARGMGVAAMNPLGGGAIPQCPDDFAHIKRRPDQPIVAAALDFVWSEPGIDVALVGMRHKKDVDEAVAAMDAYTAPGDEERAALENTIGSVNGALCTSCGYCRDCPQGIPVSKFIEAYNYYLLHNNWQDVANRLKWHWGIKDKAHLEQCIACKICEKKCTQHLDIVERLKAMLDHISFE